MRFFDPADSPSTLSFQLNPFHWRLSASSCREILILSKLRLRAIIGYLMVQILCRYHFLVCLGIGSARGLSHAVLQGTTCDDVRSGPPALIVNDHDEFVNIDS
jgi:hypothetical protein